MNLLQKFLKFFEFEFIYEIIIFVKWTVLGITGEVGVVALNHAKKVSKHAQGPVRALNLSVEDSLVMDRLQTQETVMIGRAQV